MRRRSNIRTRIANCASISDFGRKSRGGRNGPADRRANFGCAYPKIVEDIVEEFSEQLVYVHVPQVDVNGAAKHESVAETVSVKPEVQGVPELEVKGAVDAPITSKSVVAESVGWNPDEENQAVVDGAVASLPRRRKLCHGRLDPNGMVLEVAMRRADAERAHDMARRLGYVVPTEE